jgi:tetratricopeptide (TPR) repeat protein
VSFPVGGATPPRASPPEERAAYLADVWALRGTCHWQLGEGDEALAALDAGQRLAAHHPSAAMLRARIAMHREDAAAIRAAIGPLRAALAADPGSFDLAETLAQTLAAAGREDEAQRQRHVAEELRGRRAAFAELHTQAANSPRDPEVRYRLGLAAMELEMPGLAHQWFQTCVSMDRGHAEAKAALRALLSGEPLPWLVSLPATGAARTEAAVEGDDPARAVADRSETAVSP